MNLTDFSCVIFCPERQKTYKLFITVPNKICQEIIFLKSLRFHESMAWTNIFQVFKRHGIFAILFMKTDHIWSVRRICTWFTNVFNLINDLPVNIRYICKTFAGSTSRFSKIFEKHASLFALNEDIEMIINWKW